MKNVELCIVGAGIAGLNALAVAGDHLTSSDRVLLVDARERAGGMWLDTYDYVRLHQPHGIFTAGNIPWTLGREPQHLASKPEVISHLQHCLDVAGRQLDVEQRFGWSYVSHREVEGGSEVTLRAADGRTEVVRAKRLIKAFGHQVTPNDPLALSSGQVRSISPEQLDLATVDAPVWIIGGGKTAMDTAHLLVTTQPGLEVNMAVGQGTFFARRDTFFPLGARRWWAGTPINTMLRQMARRFDGTNEAAVQQWFRTTYGVSPSGEAERTFSAYLSDHEAATIRAGVRHVEHEYLADVVDRDGEPELVFRSGRTRALPRGSWIVNCTGSLLRTGHPYEPFVSPAGSTLSIQMRSSVTGPFSSFGGYYLTHLLFRDKLQGIGLYELDIEELQRKASNVVFYASVSLAMHNLALISAAVPNKVLLECGLDFDRWYPLPRRMVGTTDFLLHRSSDLEHHRAALDTVRDRFDVRCGPLQS